MWLCVGLKGWLEFFEQVAQFFFFVFNEGWGRLRLFCNVNEWGECRGARRCLRNFSRGPKKNVKYFVSIFAVVFLDYNLSSFVSSLFPVLALSDIIIQVYFFVPRLSHLVSLNFSIKFYSHLLFSVLF